MARATSPRTSWARGRLRRWPSSALVREGAKSRKVRMEVLCHSRFVVQDRSVVYIAKKHIGLFGTRFFGSRMSRLLAALEG